MLFRSTHAITPAHLQLSDPDTPAVNLTYTVTQLPRHGRLLLGGSPLLPARPRFTQAQVDRAELAYRHDAGSAAHIDRFLFLASDGTNQGYLEYGQLRAEPAAFTIQVSPTDVTVCWGEDELVSNQARYIALTYKQP